MQLERHFWPARRRRAASHKAAIRAARDDGTILTRVQPARAPGITNRFKPRCAVTRESFTYPRKTGPPDAHRGGPAGNADCLSMWAGQAPPRAGNAAAELVARLLADGGVLTSVSQ